MKHRNLFIDLENNENYLYNSTPTIAEKGWEEKLPEGISDLITKQKMFGYKKKY